MIDTNAKLFEHEVADTAGFFRISVDDYHDMIESGILTTDDKVELLDGYLVQKMPRNLSHSAIVEILTEEFFRIKPNGWRVRVQLPLHLETGEPEPDLAMVRGNRSDLFERKPRAEDVGLVVEVSDSTLPIDQSGKARIYAQSQIPFYWIINIPDQQIEVYSQPIDGAYQLKKSYSRIESIAVELDGQVIGSFVVSEFFPS